MTLIEWFFFFTSIHSSRFGERKEVQSFTTGTERFNTVHGPEREVSSREYSTARNGARAKRHPRRGKNDSIFRLLSSAIARCLETRDIVARRPLFPATSRSRLGHARQASSFLFRRRRFRICSIPRNGIVIETNAAAVRAFQFKRVRNRVRARIVIVSFSLYIYDSKAHHFSVDPSGHG